MDEQKDMPIQYSKGCLFTTADGFEVSWYENKIRKNKKFKFCKYKRTNAQTEAMANEFLETIKAKRKIWTDYIEPLRKARQTELNKIYRQTPEAKLKVAEYRKKPEQRLKNNEYRKKYSKRPNVKAKVNDKLSKKRIEAVFNNAYRCNQCHHSYIGKYELQRHLTTYIHNLKTIFNVVLTELKKKAKSE